MIERLPRVIPEAPDRPELAGPEHPIRVATREIATQPASWTPERARNTAALFDKLAPEWKSRASEGRQDPLIDALDRGRLGGGLCLEVGSGTGSSSEKLATRFDGFVSIDISQEMLVRASAAVHRVRGDGAHLPIRDAVADAIALVNMFLFPDEVERVLAPGGALLWVSSLGDRTPIYLSAQEVLGALPGDWEGVTSDAGWGCWSVLHRRS